MLFFPQNLKEDSTVVLPVLLFITLLTSKAVTGSTRKYRALRH